MSRSKKLIVFLFTLYYTSLVNSQLPQCSSPVLSSLLKEGSAYTTIMSDNSRILVDLPLLGETTNAWTFANNSRSVEFALSSLTIRNQLGYYITAIEIRTAAAVSARCLNETALNLAEYEVRYSYRGSEGGISIPDRTYPIQSGDRQIRLRIPVQLADKIIITRTGGYVTNSTLYCLQFELYGCPVPNIQREVLSYEYTQSNLIIFYHLTRYFLLPNFNPTDPLYLETGICDSSHLYCSGGLGILMDGITGTPSIDVITDALSIGFDCPNVADFILACRNHFVITLTQLFNVETIVIHGYTGTYFGDVILPPRISLTNGATDPITTTNSTGNLYTIEVEVNSTMEYIEFDIILERNSIALLTEIEIMSQGSNLAWLLSTYSPHAVQTLCPTPTTPTQTPCAPNPTTQAVNSTTLSNMLGSTIDSNKTLIILIIVLLVILLIQTTINFASSLYSNIVARSLQKNFTTQSKCLSENQRLLSQNFSGNDDQSRIGAYQSSPSKVCGATDLGKETRKDGSYGCEDKIFNPLYAQKSCTEEGYATVCENHSTKTNPFALNQESIDLDEYVKLEEANASRNNEEINPTEKRVTQYSNLNL